jgi:(p)ppGpp synthase/HD superfamily hydrolase
MESRAKAFAMYHHAAIGQVKKYTGEPYIYHPAAVVEIVRSVPHTEAMLAAAWLHDTVEDTNATIEDIEREFGIEVAGLVEMLTDTSRPGDGNRRVRKEADRQHTAMASPAAKTIKLADLIDNTLSIVRHDPKFAAVYLAEKAALLEVLREGNSDLWTLAAQCVSKHIQPVAHQGAADDPPLRARAPAPM